MGGGLKGIGVDARRHRRAAIEKQSDRPSRWHQEYIRKLDVGEAEESGPGKKKEQEAR